jgi:16S rRNA (cytosine967-C5)-methyltransferase
MARQALARWSPQEVQALLEWNNTPPGAFARVNLLKTTPERLLQTWREQENVEYDFVRRDWLPENLMFELKRHPSLGRMESFQQGHFYVQDPSTVMAVGLLEVQSGQEVLDLCAAPGGKTTYLAQLLGGQGKLVAHDTSEERLALVRENCARMGVSGVTLATPAELGRVSFGLYDRVLVDAPCSNTGVMRRRVDLRWRIRAEELERLAQAQAELLATAAGYLKPGGALVYSTCSLEPEENRGIVQRFLSLHPKFQLASERELTPFRDRVDGAYAARLRHRG